MVTDPDRAGRARPAQAVLNLRVGGWRGRHCDRVRGSGRRISGGKGSSWSRRLASTSSTNWRRHKGPLSKTGNSGRVLIGSALRAQGRHRGGVNAAVLNTASHGLAIGWTDPAWRSTSLPCSASKPNARAACTIASIQPRVMLCCAPTSRASGGSSGTARCSSCAPRSMDLLQHTVLGCKAHHVAAAPTGEPRRLVAQPPAQAGARLTSQRPAQPLAGW
jgi:hypothetical protein